MSVRTYRGAENGVVARDEGEADTAHAGRANARLKMTRNHPLTMHRKKGL